jgi:ribosomal subunit interface protein
MEAAMETGLEIAFHNMEPSDAIEEQVRERVGRLEEIFDRITSCRVVIDAPHLQHRKGNHYEVRIEVRVPGNGVLTVDREPGDVNAHEDFPVALRDSFQAMERQLRRWKETHKGRPEEVGQAHPLEGRIAELYPDEGRGEIALTDGRLVYFHRNAVVEGDFDALETGDTVEVAVDTRSADKGPHASTVRPISGAKFVSNME